MSSRSTGGDDEDIRKHDEPGNVQQGYFKALLVIDGDRGRQRGAGCLRMDCDEGSPFPGWNVVPHDDRDVHDTRGSLDL